MTTDATPQDQAPPYAWDDDEGAAVLQLAASGIVFQGHGKLHTISVAIPTLGGSVDVYDGINASGRLIWSYRDPGNLAQGGNFNPRRAVRINDGVFVVIVTALVTVVFDPRAYFRSDLP